MASDILFEPLKFRNLVVKNRILRSSISGRFDNYDGSGTQTRINWEEKFARGGAGAIISSFVAVSVAGRHVPNYATIHRDEQIPFWRAVGEKVHEYDCKYILQLNHAGRQMDFKGVDNLEMPTLSSTGTTEPFSGFLCRAMTAAEIQSVIGQLAEAARRVREAGLDGIELHGANGYLITQFLSSGINNRKDEYGGSVANRARFLLEIIRAIRKEVGTDFHLQVKLNGIDYNNAVFFWKKKGNTIEDSIQICKLLEAEGVDAIHVSSGSSFPHPRNPRGGLPLDVIKRVYPIIDSGKKTFPNYVMARYSLLRPIIRLLWTRDQGEAIEGNNLQAAKAIKQNVSVPVLCTGGFQTAQVIRDAIESGMCDAVAIARGLIANNNLPELFAQGKPTDKPCTHCNRCLYHVLEDPLGCYDLSRYANNEKMLEAVMSVYQSGMPTN
ncbi:MAG: FMN reductase [Acidobacteria bacterium 13_1_20CM_3_53_8]|nr:MAG: FMN reductase [Acidobacteria bacterium 13_1_20CM_3_53_8]